MAGISNECIKPFWLESFMQDQCVVALEEVAKMPILAGDFKNHSEHQLLNLFCKLSSSQVCRYPVEVMLVEYMIYL